MSEFLLETVSLSEEARECIESHEVGYGGRCHTGTIR